MADISLAGILRMKKRSDSHCLYLKGVKRRRNEVSLYL